MVTIQYFRYVPDKYSESKHTITYHVEKSHETDLLNNNFNLDKCYSCANKFFEHHMGCVIIDIPADEESTRDIHLELNNKEDLIRLFAKDNIKVIL